MHHSHSSGSSYKKHGRKTLSHTKNLCDFAILESSMLLFGVTNVLGKIEVINLKTFRRVKLINVTCNETAPSRIINRVEIHTNSRTVCCLQCLGLTQITIFIWNLTKNTAAILPFEYISSAICFTFFHDYLLTAGSSSRIRFWELPSGDLVDQISFNLNSISFVQLKASEKRNILYCLEHTSNKIWVVNLLTKQLLLTLGLGGTSSFMELLPSGKLVTISNQDKCLKFWETGPVGNGKLDMKVEFSKNVEMFSNFTVLMENEGNYVWMEKNANGLKICRRSGSKQCLESLSVKWNVKNFVMLPVKRVGSKRWLILHTGYNIKVFSLQFLKELGCN